jgi:hypothetical protein
MYTKLDNKTYETIMTKIRKSYMPPEKTKPKFTLRQLFFLKKNLKR